jgi:hypothetical protein
LLLQGIIFSSCISTLLYKFQYKSAINYGNLRPETQVSGAVDSKLNFLLLTVDSIEDVLPRLATMRRLINVGLLTIKLFLTQDFYVSADNESRSTSLACTLYQSWRSQKVHANFHRPFLEGLQNVPSKH